jgi:hypothetical protein
MDIWRITAKRPDGTILIKLQSSESVEAALMEAVTRWLYEVRGNFTIEIEELRDSASVD